MMGKKSKKSKRLKWLSAILALIVLAFLGAGMYFYNVAIVPGHKTFLSSNKPLTKSDSLYQEKLWYKKATKKHLYMMSSDNKLRLDANYIKNNNSKKTVIILHGYMNNKDGMGEYAALFHSLGYNVLLPDARGHGQSQGNYVGYGWMEKDDVKKWIQKLLKDNPKQEIVIFGVSMGGATTMMTSGLKLPSQVKAFIEDCGYTNAKNEIEHEAQAIYSMPTFPRFPLVEILSGITRLRAGYFLGDADSIKMLKHNTKPMLFIYGAKDTFVPTEMVYKNYRASRGPKQLWVVPGASHAKSFATHPHEYKAKIKAFLNKYIK